MKWRRKPVTNVLKEDAARPRRRSADRPIVAEAEDLLGRGGFARMLAAEALAPAREEGFVIGLTGPWGSGKTSVLKLVEQALGEDAVMVSFNPWLFSKGDELVVRFLAELAVSLG